MIPAPHAKARRAAFWAYAAILFIGTHYPKIQVPGTGRPDLLVHFVAFGLWALLLIGCAYFGPALSGRNLALCALAGTIYAAADEALQGLPFIGRVPAVDDWGANVVGILIAVAAAASLRLVALGRGQTASAPTE